MGRRHRWRLANLILGLVLAACGSEPDARERPQPRRGALPDEVDATTGPLVIFLGDSLSAGYGLREDEAFPALWAAARRDAGQPVRLVNAGISGDTSAGGLARVDWLLRQEPDVLVVELGANDGLRGLSVEETRANLDQIIQRGLDAGARVLLLGMKIPPSYGRDYSGQFELLFEELAGAREVVLMPFLLEGVAADPELNLADGIHPNAAGHRRLAQAVAPYLEKVLTGLD